jgi:hypothetical protein
MIQEDAPRPVLFDEAEAIYSAFGSLLEFSGGMDPFPVIRYEAVTNWLEENEIFLSSEREAVRYLLRSMLSTQRAFRDENKPRN